MPGELVNVTVKVTNAAGAAVTNPLQYLQIAVTEDVTYPDVIDASIAGLVYMENDVDHTNEEIFADLTLVD